MYGVSFENVVLVGGIIGCIEHCRCYVSHVLIGVALDHIGVFEPWIRCTHPIIRGCFVEGLCQVCFTVDFLNKGAGTLCRIVGGCGELLLCVHGGKPFLRVCGYAVQTDIEKNPLSRCLRGV